MTMKTRLILATGFAAGYYLGAKAGRQRYEQLNRLIGKARRSSPAVMAGEKAKEVAEEGFDRAKDKVGHKLHHRSNGKAEAMEFMPS
jgi:L-alanine-DL-glutamate epimerase-like enolase superfamily enzyme